MQYSTNLTSLSLLKLTMGTRGLLGFIIAGCRRASYNHFDSYPSGLGAQVAKFILGLKEEEKRAMLEHVRNVCPLS